MDKPRRLVAFSALGLWIAFASGCKELEVRLPEIARPQGPLSLAATVDLALRNSPDLLQAQSRLERARVAVDLAVSDYWPVLQIIEGYTRADKPSQAFGAILDQRRFESSLDFNDPGATSNWRTGIGGSITIYDGGRRRARTRARRAEALATEAALSVVRDDIAFETARAFFSVHQAREIQRAAEKAVAAWEARERLADARAAQGAARREDVLTARAAVAEARGAIVTTRSAAESALAALRLLLALPQTDSVELVAPEESALDPVPALASLLDLARGRRVELVEAAARFEAARARAQEAAAGYLPEITLFGSFGFDDRDPFDLNHANWSWGVGVIESLFDAIKAPHHVKRALADLAAAAAAARKAQIEVEHDVNEALLDVNGADARHAIALEIVAHAQEALRAAASRLDAGAATPTSVIEAELKLVQARSWLQTVSWSRVLARIALDHAIGRAAPRASVAKAPANPRTSP